MVVFMVPRWKVAVLQPAVHRASQIFKVPSAGGSSIIVVEIPTATSNQAGPGPTEKESGWEIGNMPMESRDGRLLFFKVFEGVWKFPLAGGHPELLVPIPWYTPYAVSRDGLFFHGEAAPTTNKRALLHYRFVDGVIREIVHTGPRPAMGLAVSPDDNTVLVSQVDRDLTTLLFTRGAW